MQLKDFVRETLEQILAGIREAQASEGGAAINPKLGNMGPAAPKGNLMDGGALGMFSCVDFDVALSVETKGKAGANLKVIGIGVEAGGDHSRGQANRIVFSVPLRLPDGGDIDQSPRIVKVPKHEWT
jgi:hypothetical protein